MDDNVITKGMIDSQRTVLAWEVEADKKTLLTLIRSLEERISRLERNSLFPDAEGRMIQGMQEQRGIL